MLLLHNIVFFLLPASGADIPDPKVVGEDLLPRCLPDPLLHIRQPNVRDFPAPAANQVIVPFRPVIPVRRTRLGDAEQKPLLRQTVRCLYTVPRAMLGCSLFISRNTCSAVGCCCSSVTAANISSAYFGILRPSKIRTILILVFHYTHIRPVVNSYGGLPLKKLTKKLDMPNCICYSYSINYACRKYRLSQEG